MKHRLQHIVRLVSVMTALSVSTLPAHGQTDPILVNERLELHWLDAHRAWYRSELSPNEHQYVLVDAAKGTRTPLFDHDLLARRLAERTGGQVHANRLPVEHLAVLERSIALFVRDEDGLLMADRDSLLLRNATASEFKELSQPIVSDPGVSSHGGNNSVLVVHNATESVVRMVWVDASGNRRPYSQLEPGQTARQHTYAGHVWTFIADDETSLGGVRAGRTTTVLHLTEQAPNEDDDAPQSRPAPPGLSRDGIWLAEIRNHNVFLVHRETNVSRQLTDDGSSDNRYIPRFYWSTDASRLVVLRTTRGAERRVHYVEAAPRDQLQPKLHSYAYRKPGDEIPQTFPHLFDVEQGTEITLDQSLFSNPWSNSRFRWSEDGKRFTFIYNQRGHQVVRVIAIDGANGNVRALINEECETFFDYSNKLYKFDVPPSVHRTGGEIVWMSERDGWNHLYLVDASTGALMNQITRGAWVVRRVDRVDTDKRQIWFRAMGIHPDQDPYHVHFARIDFDGSNLTLLTDGDGTHEIDRSPDGSYIIARHSRADQPPIRELRCNMSGDHIMTLEEAQLVMRDSDVQWHMPTRFVAKGRDGITDIHGLILWPRDYDASKSYPVIESIYAGPHGAHVPKSFRLRYGHQRELTDLGFIVVMIDGMGTNWRSKAFHDHCWKNIGDAGFPDRIRWLQAASETYPAIDLERVGIYGGSAGGQNAMRALIDHPDMYKVAVADCGCHDNRMDKIWWNEAWMGWPVDESYEESSNVAHAHRMEGKLLLIVGEKDENVDPASTIQVVDALIQANKDFDFLLIPGAGHGAAETPYGRRIRREFFVRHLMHEH